MTMNANEAYQWLMEASADSEVESFDIHIVASILAVAMADDGQAVGAGVGLSGAELRALVAEVFPGAVAGFAGLSGELEVDEEEQSLRDLLMMYASGTRFVEPYLAAMVARRCQFPHHLWQDLGLHNRAELSRLMSRHFQALAARNSNDMKWKKFLYRQVCRSEGFSLCVAPVCSDCDDFINCFGAEDGEARLARARNGMEMAA